MMMMLGLIAMLYFHTGVLGESQELASTSRNPSPSPALLSYIQNLKNAKVELLDRQVKNVLKSRLISASSSARDSLSVKAEDVKESINDSTVLKGRVKRYQHRWGRHFGRQSPPRCVLGICRTLNLAHSMYHLGNTKGKDPSAPKSTDDPNSFGKRRRRSLVSLLRRSIRLNRDRRARKE
ncbi:uncharacterized protein LOC144669305 [Cetorhinus maximus]